MSTLARKASKFFSIRSSSGTSSDRVPRVKGSVDGQEPNRAASLPVNNVDRPPAISMPVAHIFQGSEGSTLGPGTPLVAESLVDSPPPMPQVVDVGLNGYVDTDAVVLDGLAPIVDKANAVIHKDDIRATERSHRE